MTHPQQSKTPRPYMNELVTSTPRVDGLVGELSYSGPYERQDAYKEFARTLERELSTAQEKLGEARELLKALLDKVHEAEIIGCSPKLNDAEIRKWHVDLTWAQVKADEFLTPTPNERTEG